ncbi:uncharacterized protein BJ171DRAFT_528891 [Polychytrium aggregatum]|uniref:uncharacterized protein n=1 Tax=Polychytrium aggregatum TaxID=110093 RepID=UPI0022FE1ACB|nr:uncharacterized protein BJ171DRAFT_528891 [Polychytrium aggregatum]KAI9193318.1 hypothetical protein BJ171DRAFT_528891 [Polychytrium aggregatum]
MASRKPVPNLYMFRNMITSKVLVSPKFQLEPTLLRQIGEHRPSAKIRADHWVPFAVLTGLRAHTSAEFLADRIVADSLFKNPLSKPTLPLRGSEQYQPWTIPEAVRQRTIELCKLLNSEEFQSQENLSDALTETDESAQEFPRSLELHWERDEYQHVVSDADVEQDQDQVLMWPMFVDHRKLKLLRNRYPVVDGLDLKGFRLMPTKQEAEL